MSDKQTYEAPKAEVTQGSSGRNEEHGRRAYVMFLFCIFILIPLLGNFFLGLIGIETDALTSSQTNERAGFSLDMLAFWYIQIPLFVYVTRNRVKDAGLNQWFTLLFILPVINLAMWFWPPRFR